MILISPRKSDMHSKTSCSCVQYIMTSSTPILSRTRLPACLRSSIGTRRRLTATPHCPMTWPGHLECVAKPGVGHPGDECCPPVPLSCRAIRGSPSRREPGCGWVLKQALIQVSISPQTAYGPIVTTINQMGGQATNSIVNVGPQPRRIESRAAAAIVHELKKLPAVTFSVHTQMGGNGASLQLALAIQEILERAGWHSFGLMYSVFYPPVANILVQTPCKHPEVEQPGLHSLIQLLLGNGLITRAAIDPNIDEVQIIVGPRS